VRACPGVKSYDRAAMNTIVFGRGSSSCSDAKSADQVGMCDIFPRITPANVKIVYAQTGLGYAGRPGGPMPPRRGKHEEPQMSMEREREHLAQADQP
jgi:hypothetical protein